MQTLADKESKELRRRNKEQMYKEMLKTDVLPRGLISGKIISTFKDDPEEVLKKAGYKRSKSGWRKPIDAIYCYHAFVRPDRNSIELHTDKFKKKKEGWYHLSSTYLCDREKNYIRQFIHSLTSQNGKRKGEFLSQKDMRKAFEELKKNRRPIKRSLWSKICNLWTTLFN